MRAKHRAGRWSLRSELPEDAVTGSARITLSGKRSALVEGHHGVVEMSDACIRLASAGGVISIRGRMLGIKELSLDAAVVTGEEIESIGYGDRLR